MEIETGLHKASNLAAKVASLRAHGTLRSSPIIVASARHTVKSILSLLSA
jgi:hypothetical protein